jgi:uncharacterized protein (DUF1800 family)
MMTTNPIHARLLRLIALAFALTGATVDVARADDPATCVDPRLAPVYPADTGSSGVTTPVDAVRFLNSATFGANGRDVVHLGGMTKAQWIAEQFRMKASCHLESLNITQDNNNRDNRLEVWWRHAVTAPDQLRQRVAFALSEILVVSDNNSSIPPNALTHYYDILLRNAFGNYRDILERVTLSPAMGTYLSMLGNQKPNRAEGIRADENYAREIMQLFSIGLVQLNLDGSPVLVDGKTVPTYSQADIEGLARVFTGWTWGDSLYFWDGDNWQLPMKAFQSYHDRKDKTILNGTLVAANGTAEQDLALALDTIFNHPNVGPFLGKQLIQRLVTSNPSPAYIARVAAKFNDNGQGVRGDMKAVIRQVLLDAEAQGSTTVNPNFGKLREPILAMSHLWRAFNASAVDGRYYYMRWDNPLGQVPMSAPSVFNFFKPNFSPSGPLKRNGLVGPEFQLVNDARNVSLYNELYWRINHYYKGNPWADRDDILINISTLKSKATKSADLVAYLDLNLTGRRLPAEFKTTLTTYLDSVPLDNWEGTGIRRSLDALYLVMSSPYYLIQY